jgi:hypothetical protein
MGLGTEARKAELGDLAGVALQHDLHLVVRDWGAWNTIAERLSRAGADVHALHVARHEAEYSVRCRLERISAEAARRLTRDLLDAGIADRGNVEHLVLAKPYAKSA